MAIHLRRRSLKPIKNCLNARCCYSVDILDPDQTLLELLLQKSCRVPRFAVNTSSAKLSYLIDLAHTFTLYHNLNERSEELEGHGKQRAAERPEEPIRQVYFTKCTKECLTQIKGTKQTTLVAIEINENKQTQASAETDETKDTSHLVNANKKQTYAWFFFNSSATTINLSNVVLPTKKRKQFD